MKISIICGLLLSALAQGLSDLNQPIDEQAKKELDHQLNLALIGSSQDLWEENAWQEQQDPYKIVTKGFFGSTLFGWQMAGNKGGKYFSECGVRGLVGGHDVLGANGWARVIEDSLPPHSFLQLTIRLFKIDEWDGKTIAISVDGKYIWAQVWHPNTGTGYLCGTPGKPDGEILLQLETPHTANSATIAIVTNLAKDASLASWGFREYQLSFK